MYFKTKEDTELGKALNGLLNKITDSKNKINDRFKKELDEYQGFVKERGIIAGMVHAVVFSKEFTPGKNWKYEGRSSDNRKMYSPKMNTKEGRIIYDKLFKLPKEDHVVPYDITGIMGNSTPWWYPGIQHVESEKIVLIRFSENSFKEFKPNDVFKRDAVEITYSQYTELLRKK